MCMAKMWMLEPQELKISKSRKHSMVSSILLKTFLCERWDNFTRLYPSFRFLEELRKS